MPGSWWAGARPMSVARGGRAGASTLLETIRKSASIAATLVAPGAGFAEGVAGSIRPAHVHAGNEGHCDRQPVAPPG